MVLDFGREAGLSPGLELMVHRDAKLVGKLKVSSLSDRNAVADILASYDPAPPNRGHQVLYVKL